VRAALSVNRHQAKLVLNNGETQDHIVQETHHEMRIPEREVTYIILYVYLLTLIHSYNK